MSVFKIKGEKKWRSEGKQKSLNPFKTSKNEATVTKTGRGVLHACISSIYYIKLLWFGSQSSNLPFMLAIQAGCVGYRCELPIKSED